MAEMLIDGAKLDACNTAEADAIRAKTGGSSPIPYDYANNKGFADAIAAIPSGGGEDKLIAYATGNDIGDLYYPEITGTLLSNAFAGCLAETVFFPKATASSYSFSGMPNLLTAVVNSLAVYSQFASCPKLKVFDGINITAYFHYTFTSCPKVDTLILRRTDAIVPLQSMPTLNNTCFKNGGSGGTIYIPKVLYDHLGDGTSLDYKAATNWSTFDGYGTITWAQIEGSIYETQYADGTPIPSE